VGVVVTAGYFAGWRFRALIISVVVAVGGYLVISLYSGWQDVVEAFWKIGLPGTLIALALSLLNYGLRFIRWQMYLESMGHKVAWRPSLRIYLSGFALTTTPGKAGEAFRGVLLKQRGVPLPATLAAFVSERLSDLIAIVLLTLLGLSQYPQAQNLVLIGIVAILAMLVALSSRRFHSLLLKRSETYSGRFEGAFRAGVALLKDAHNCHSPWLLCIATLLSVVAWGGEALAFYWVLQWLGSDISLSFAVFIYALSVLAGAISFLPGGLGSAEAVMISLLVLKGMTMPVAIAATVFIRLATLWFAVFIGLVALIRSRHGEALPDENNGEVL
jgi:uncharacterized protein (TIRG00374 family)